MGVQLSVVTTMYRSAPYLREFYARISAAATRLGPDYEIIFVNDGSPDESLELAVGFHEQDPRVKVIDLSRNFGHHKAIMTGLAHARGERVFLIDCDLEEEPELLERFTKEIEQPGVDVVYGVQERRKGALFERLSGSLFYSLYNALSDFPIPRNLITMRLMSSRYVRSLVEHREREINIAGLWVVTGYEQRSLLVSKKSKGTTTYDLARRLAVFVAAITSFTNKPLVGIFYLGCLILVSSAAAACYLIIRRVAFGVLLAGWPSLMVSIWFLGGLTIFSLGVIGIYLSKIFNETKQRPYTVIRRIYDHAP